MACIPRFRSTLCFVLLWSFFLAENSQAAGQWLHTSGNKIFTENNQVWVGHGVNVMDPRNNDSFFNNDNPNRALFLVRDVTTNKKANLLRLPLLSAVKIDNPNSPYMYTISEVIRNPSYLAAIKALVDQLSTVPNTYIMISLWQDPTIVYSFQHSQPDGYPTANTDEVYNKLVDTFGSYPYVIFGVTNEPAHLSAADTKATMEHAVATIRTREANNGVRPHLIAVQATSFTKDVSYYISNPITASGGSNIIYEAHLYDNLQVAHLLSAADSLPVIVGEYGPAAALDRSNIDWQNCYGGSTDNSFSNAQISAAIAQFRAKEISYMAWSYSESSPPNMIGTTPHDSGNPNCWKACSVSTAIASPTSFGKIVLDDLATPYISKKTKGAVNLLMQ